MSIPQKAASFLALAREDLGAAKVLLPSSPRHTAFLLSQAAEKIIKAVLTVEGISDGTNHHQLGRLVDMLPSHHFWRKDLMELDKLTPSATLYRYPVVGGAMSAVPSIERLASRLHELEDLLPEVTDWCREG